MSAVLANKKDIAWNYIGTVMSLAGGFLLLPLLLVFLSDDELGLWYVFLAIGNLTQLFEFGFNPTFARNIVYCMSGARKLTKTGFDRSSVSEGIDWHLLNILMSVAKTVFGIIAVITLIGVAVAGTFYISIISSDLEGISYWFAWGIFCVAIFLNLYYLYSLTFLRGIGDIAAENKAKTFARIAQIVVTAVMLILGFGLIGAAVGYLCNGILLRMYALYEFRRHDDIVAMLDKYGGKASKQEKRVAFDTVFSISWRDGFVQLAGYFSTQATSILSSIFLGLSITGTLSVLQQLVNAVYAVSQAYVGTYYPSFQSAYAQGNMMSCRNMVSKGVSIYWLLIFGCTAGVVFIVFPILPLFKPTINLDIALYLGLTLYYSLWQQHSIFCCFIISTNKIPYLWGYLISAVFGVGLSAILMGPLSLGAWGLILGQGLVQLAFNNWYWPRYLCCELNTNYFLVLKKGAMLWFSTISKFAHLGRRSSK